ncbi:MAG: LacI family DNA-binding transcriptional regulator [Rhodothermales bacterium]|nr:LacI family DNA-binding transcriptional regulator [Rhodothermales bacterium]
MTREKPTIYDVASEAGVAISTVSRVLNGSPGVSDPTRERVEAAIEHLGFRPKRTARTLAQQEEHALAVAMPSFTSLFFVELLKGVKDELRERDIDLLLCNLGSTGPYQTLYRFLDRGAVDGLLLASLPLNAPLERELMRLNAPVVLIGTEHERLDCLYWDDDAGAERAVAHLAERGHARIGLIAAHPWSYDGDARLGGYRRALEAAGLDFDPALVVTGETEKHAGYSEEVGYEAMQKLLALPEPPTAVFASADVQAFGAWSALRDGGLRVPEDVALVGYDGLKLSRYLGLTTVDRRMYNVGRRATQRLLERLSSDTEERYVERVDPDLVVRRSSGAATATATGA